jgi:hypothetical protein
MARFLILSYHDAYFNQGEGFDVVQNTERLTMSLSKLQESYSQACFKRHLDLISQDLCD